MAWSRINSWGNTNSTGSGNISVSATGVTVGNLLVAVVNNNTSAIASVSDGSNTYTSLGTKTGLNSSVLALYYSKVTTGGSLTITGNSQAFAAIAVIEFSPGSATIATDGANPSATASNTAPSTGNITVTVGDLVLGAFGLSGNNGITSSTNGNFIFDSTSASANVNGAHYGAAITYYLSAASSPQNPAMTVSGTTGWSAIGAAFKATAITGSVFMPANWATGAGGPFFQSRANA